MNKTRELVFISCAGIGHLASTVEFGKLILDRDERLSITVLIMKWPYESKLKNPYNDSDSSNHTRLRFLELPDTTLPPNTYVSGIIDAHKPHVRNVLLEVIQSGVDIAGLVLDMFFSPMIDVANEFNIPSYIYLTSGASFLGLLLHLQSLRDEHNHDIIALRDSDAELVVPCFENSVPAKVLPTPVVNKDLSTWFLDMAKRFREAKGIVINTFVELESHAIDSLRDSSMKYPPIYPVGPILNISDSDRNKKEEAELILKWLDDQPVKSVVFLCFGSMGSFAEEQRRQIANALMKSGQRFLWSIRRPPPLGTFESPGEYSNYEEVLPKDFLEQTAETGRVIGWAPQTAVLSHPSVGGFVSHCGWNSTLESIWFGVPIAAWPMHAEQQLNAFAMVKEFRLATAIKLDYRKDFGGGDDVIVMADEIEKGITSLMDTEHELGIELRRRVRQMSEKSRVAVSDGGSSCASLGLLIHDVLRVD